MYNYCKNYVEDCCDAQGKPCQFLGEDNWCHKNMVEFYLEKVFNNLKKNHVPTEERIIFIVGLPEDYSIEKIALEKLGYNVEIQERAGELEEFREQMRRADVLADYVYTEEIGVETFIRPEKNLNAAGTYISYFSRCRNVGLMNYLNFAQIHLYGKKVVVYGDDIDLVDKLIAAGAVVISSNRYVDLNWQCIDLIINLNSEINCYPIHFPVIDIANKCINIDNREVVQDCHLLNTVGILEQLW